ncbi:MAG: D-alanine--D-alanine ligase [Oscillospiraceae bacterium]|nr:D-alanine--D-alanine ligase [Oscillospiraceae bacterium]
MNIIVLCGGLSLERDVSLVSGASIANALRERGHRAVLVDLFFGYRGEYDKPEDIFTLPYDDSFAEIKESEPDLDAIKMSRNQPNDSRIGDNVVEICRAADIVFLVLHGADGEDGRLQAMFDLCGIKYTGCGYLGSALAMNKEIAKKIFIQSGIKTPRGIVVSKFDKVRECPGIPCVVKPRSGGSSVGTSVVTDMADYDAALEAAFRCEDYALVENYVSGREVDVAVLAGRALPPIEIRPKSGWFDYKNKYQSGMTDEICPTDFPQKIINKLTEAAVNVHNALNIDIYSRMDFIVDENGEPWCLEANTLPGMTPASLMPKEAAAIGISYGELCEMIISESMKKYK